MSISSTWSSEQWCRSIFYILMWIAHTQCNIPTFDSKSSHFLSDIQSWTHHILMDNGLEILWNANGPEWLIMEMTAPTTGYVGIGFSPNGGMTGSDIVIGWVDENGTPHLNDYYGIENGVPSLDLSQDYEPILVFQTENTTTVRFRRKWNTCDKEHDIEIGDDTVRLIWAWSVYDPKESLHWHGPIHRGTRTLFLRSLQTSRRFPDDNPIPGVHEWVVQLKNHHVPVRETTYYCQIFKIPYFPKDQHIIGYRPMVSIQNRPYIHHMTAYKCSFPPSVGVDVLEQYLNSEGGDCLTDEVPSEWIQYCYEMWIAVGIGSEGDMFPDHLGMPFVSTKNGESSYIRFEIHYDNPGLHKIVDSSGLKFFYTDQLRVEDIGTLFVGGKVTPFHVIPQNLKMFTTYTFCAGSCTKTAFGKSGIKVIGVLLHAHTAGTAVRLRHIRDGEELTPLAVDNHYDFNYQQFRMLSEEVRVLPGDDIIVECDYNSVGRSDSIIGGFPSGREMCQALLWTYPKNELLVGCQSQVEYHSFFDALEMEEISHPLLTALNLPYVPSHFSEKQWKTVPMDNAITMRNEFPQYRNSNSNPWKDIKGLSRQGARNKSVDKSTSPRSIYQQILNKSSNLADAKILQDKWNYGSHYIFCAGLSGIRIPNKDIIQNMPKFIPYVSPIKDQCSTSDAVSHTKLAHLSNVFILSQLTLLIGHVI